MVTLLLDSARLEVVLSGTEKALARRRQRIIVAREHLAKVQLTDDAWTWLRGVPRPGSIVRGVLAFGTWRFAGAADFVIVRRRHPAVVIDLDGHEEFERIVLTTRHGIELVQALQLEAEAEPAEVTAIVTGAVPIHRPATRRSPRPSPATA